MRRRNGRAYSMRVLTALLDVRGDLRDVMLRTVSLLLGCETANAAACQDVRSACVPPTCKRASRIACAWEVPAPNVDVAVWRCESNVRPNDAATSLVLSPPLRKSSLPSSMLAISYLLTADSRRVGAAVMDALQHAYRSASSCAHKRLCEPSTVAHPTIRRARVPICSRFLVCKAGRG